MGPPAADPAAAVQFNEAVQWCLGLRAGGRSGGDNPVALVASEEIYGQRFPDSFKHSNLIMLPAMRLRDSGGGGTRAVFFFVCASLAEVVGCGLVSRWRLGLETFLSANHATTRQNKTTPHQDSDYSADSQSGSDLDDST